MNHEYIERSQLVGPLKIKGWLKKKSPKSLIVWRLRYFYINESRMELTYSIDDKKIESKGAIPLAAVFEIKQNGRKFSLFIAGREYKLKTEFEEGAAKWVKNLNKIIQFLH